MLVPNSSPLPTRPRERSPARCSSGSQTTARAPPAPAPCPAFAHGSGYACLSAGLWHTGRWVSQGHTSPARALIWNRASAGESQDRSLASHGEDELGAPGRRAGCRGASDGRSAERRASAVASPLSRGSEELVLPGRQLHEGIPGRLWLAGEGEQARSGPPVLPKSPYSWPREPPWPLGGACHNESRPWSHPTVEVAQRQWGGNAGQASR